MASTTIEEQYTVNGEDIREDDVHNQNGVDETSSVNGADTPVNDEVLSATNGNGCSVDTESNASLEDTVAKLEHALSRNFKRVTSLNEKNNTRKRKEPLYVEPGNVLDQ